MLHATCYGDSYRVLSSNVISAMRYTGYVKARSSGSHILAVSGGVDSVVMLDMARRRYGAARLVVAHFDHGIRSESAAEAKTRHGGRGMIFCTLWRRILRLIFGLRIIKKTRWSQWR